MCSQIDEWVITWLDSSGGAGHRGSGSRGGHHHSVGLHEGILEIIETLFLGSALLLLFAFWRGARRWRWRRRGRGQWRRCGERRRHGGGQEGVFSLVAGWRCRREGHVSEGWSQHIPCWAIIQDKSWFWQFMTLEFFWSVTSHQVGIQATVQKDSNSSSQQHPTGSQTWGRGTAASCSSHLLPLCHQSSSGKHAQAVMGWKLAAWLQSG